MATRLAVSSGGVNTTSIGTYCVSENYVSPVLIRNTGDNTFFVGSVDTTDPNATVSPYSGFPVRPGESFEFPAQTAPGYRLGFNTESGGSTFRAIGLINV